MMNDFDFGKELGLMHELAITGRKAGMRTSDYTFLKEDEGWFRRVAQLCQHLTVIKEHQIPIEPISLERTIDLIELVRKVVNTTNPNCLPCIWGEGLRPAFPLFVSSNVLGRDASILAATPEAEHARVLQLQIGGYKARFATEVGKRLIEIGFHPAELPVVNRVFRYSSDKERYLVLMGGSCESSNDYFAEQMNLLVAQRNVLAQMKMI